MRLFTAILFEENVKSSLFHTIEKLKENTRAGSFTDRENLHLTVNFIGESKRLEEVKRAMDTVVKQAQTGQFELLIRGFGKLKREDGDIYWVGIEKEPILWKFQKELVKALKEEGFFDLDDREFKPHLTLGRRIKVRENFQAREFEDGIMPMEMMVSRLSLMKSERIRGKLVYTEIYHVELDN